MTSEQCRQARNLLGFSQHRLARLARMSQAYVSMYERTGCVSAPVHSSVDRIAAIRAALEAAGVIFTNGSKPGVKLRKCEPGD